MALTAIGTASLTAPTTTTYTLVPGLTFSVEAGGVYRFAANLTWSTNATGSVALLRMGGTATATFISYRVAINLNTNGSTGHQMYAVMNQTTAGNPGSAGAIGTTYGLGIDGVIDVNAAGTLQVEASSTAATVTIATNGVYTIERIG
jgi:hypothetical protein